jgi:glycosyltransferase involved in cell wall biosynthesis
MTMRVLIAHNRYRFAGGEERYVDLLETGLTDAGVTARRFERDSADIAGSPWRRAAAGVSLAYRPGGGGIGRALAEVEPDVVHFNNIWPLLTPAALRLAHRRGAAVVLTVHNYRFACPSGTLYGHGHPHDECVEGSSLLCSLKNRRDGVAESLAYGIALEAHRRLKMLERWVDAFVAPSEFVRRMLIRAGIPSCRIRVIPNGIPLPELTSDPGVGGALYLGRLAEEKGLRTLLDAARLAPDVSVVVAGDGPLVEDIRNSRVDYVGMLRGASLAQAMDDAAFTVVPSEWYDNQPFAALEALAAGRPVIATRIGGLPEIVRDGLDGLLVEPHAPVALAAAMKQLAEDPAYARTLGASAAKSARERFGLPQHVSRVVELYREITASKASARR